VFVQDSGVLHERMLHGQQRRGGGHKGASPGTLIDSLEQDMPMPGFAGDGDEQCTSSPQWIQPLPTSTLPGYGPGPQVEEVV